MLTFLESPRYLENLARAGASGVITTSSLAGMLGFVEGLAISDAPRRSFFILHNHLATRTGLYWEDFPTCIDASARIHPTAWVAEKNVRIGPRTVIEPHAVIAERSIIGADCMIRAGAVIGSAGFQIGRVEGQIIDMVHGGGVCIGDNVHILANAVIASAVFRQSTTIGEGSRIGNLAFVSHNVQVGRRCVIGHNSVVNGNVTIDDDAWVGPGASITHCVRIGEKARISLGSAVIGDVEAGQHVTGNVAISHRRFLRFLAR
jgi:UDP-3-O-[3-hydroxymyristoyl] glucosamine N-acyltransferase